MTIIPRLIARYAIVLYVLCALGVLFYIRAAFLARRKEDVALFSLEREDAASQNIRSWLMAGVCVLIGLGVYGMGRFVVPNLPSEPAQETPEIAFLLTPSPVATITSPPTMTPEPTATRAPVPTVAPIATPLQRAPDTPVPTSSGEGVGGLVPAACTSAGTQIVSPRNGDYLSGAVDVAGTANLPNFSFYKFEVQWPGSTEWVTLQSFDTPVAGGFLGTWDTTPEAYQPGVYKFRLVVVDNTGNFPEPCVISVILE
jgi:hypothetical protein